MSQQFGCGFYKKCNLHLYDNFHCYLNIPDTSGRDSLFQAEARRCKQILNSCIDTQPLQRHLCVFDELYSGTNPDEATQSSTAFLNYLSTNKNVISILTTHYVDICKNVKDNKRICNYKMNTEPVIDDHNKNTNFNYTYKLKKGISRVNGGIKVLIDLDYPDEIVGLRK
jgi:DNA mismatch repair ATPase MutS